MFRPDPVEVGKFIQQQRKLCGFSRQKMVELMADEGVETSRSSIERTEAGARFPSMDEVFGLSWVMGLTPNEIFSGGQVGDEAYYNAHTEDTRKNEVMDIVYLSMLMSRRSRNLMIEFARGRVALDNPGADAQEVIDTATTKAALAVLRDWDEAQAENLGDGIVDENGELVPGASCEPDR